MILSPLPFNIIPMKWSLAVLFFFSSLYAEVDYHKLLNQFPETFGRNGSWKRSEIEIASDPAEIKRIEKLTYQRFIRLGHTKEDALRYSKVGVIAEDHYWIWIRDAVTFPGGIPGTYNRIVWKSGLTGTPVVVILPVLKNGKFVLNVNFRHATRSWEIELPRGGRQPKEDSETAAKRELKEETGCLAKKMIFLGEAAPETGVLSGTMDVFFCRVLEKKARHQNESEAIALNLELSLKEIEEAFIKGYLITDIKGVKTKVYCRDPFMSFALLQAKLRKLI